MPTPPATLRSESVAYPLHLFQVDEQTRSKEDLLSYSRRYKVPTAQCNLRRSYWEPEAGVAQGQTPATKVAMDTAHLPMHFRLTHIFRLATLVPRRVSILPPELPSWDHLSAPRLCIPARGILSSRSPSRIATATARGTRSNSLSRRGAPHRASCQQQRGWRRCRHCPNNFLRIDAVTLCTSIV